MTVIAWGFDIAELPGDVKCDRVNSPAYRKLPSNPDSWIESKNGGRGEEIWVDLSQVEKFVLNRTTRILVWSFLQTPEAFNLIFFFIPPEKLATPLDACVVTVLYAHTTQRI